MRAAACHTLSFDTASHSFIHPVMGFFKSRVSPSAQWLIVEDDPDDPAGRSEPPRPNCCIRAIILIMMIGTVLLTCTALAILIAASNSAAADKYWEEEMELGVMSELNFPHVDGSFQILATNASAAVILNFVPGFATELKLTFNEQDSSTQFGTPESCLGITGEALSCLSWNNSVRLEVSEYPIPGVHCMELRLEARDATACLQLEGRHIYGGPELLKQKWPLERNQPFLRVPYLAGYEGLREVVKRYWVTSSGELLFVPNDVNLFWSLDSEKICFTSSKDIPFDLEDNTGGLDLIVCGAEDAPSVYKATASRLLSNSMDVDVDLTGLLIWQTRAKADANKTSQSAVIDYALKIREHQFPGSNLEIDENWESCYGQTEFDTDSMPDPLNMTKYLHDLGFNVTLWTHPFINKECASYEEAEELDLLFKGVDNKTANLNWWHGEGGLLDFFEQSTVEWFNRRLLKLKNAYNIDGFKFDTGGVSYVLSVESARPPADISDAYEESAFKSDVERRLSEITLPLNLRTFDKDSVWGDNNGLGSLIPTLLTYNMVGKSIVIPTMTGTAGEYPEKELYIRWMQAAAFIPVMQLTYPPWDFDQETVEIAKKCVELHVRLTDSFYTLARQRAVSGIPINLPVWWVAPHDSIAQTIDSEFLLGEDYLVAPVLVKGAVARDIYLPEGAWSEGFLQDNGQVHNGPVWLRNHSAPLNHLPFFQRL